MKLNKILKLIWKYRKYWMPVFVKYVIPVIRKLIKKKRNVRN